MFETTPYNVIYHIIGVYEMALIVMGTIGSILTFIVAFKLRHTTTFVFILFLSVTDALCLYWWNLDDFILIYFNYWFQENSLYGCKIINYFQYVSMQASAWLLVSPLQENCFPTHFLFNPLFKIALSVDRFMSVWLKSWKTTHFKPKLALITGTGIIVFFALIHTNVWFTFGYRDIESSNETYIDYCHNSITPSIEFMNLWNLVGRFLYLKALTLINSNLD